MSKKIESKNQSGGITAFNVDVADNSKDAKKESAISKSEKGSKLAKIAVWVTIVAGILAILTYFGIKPIGEKIMPKKEINVTSYNQTGGITAYNVNIDPQDRKLTPQLAEQLMNNIKQNGIETVTVTSVMGDQEAFQFASVIKAFLNDQGVTVNGVNQAVFSKPIQGQIIEPGKDPKTIKVIIGGR